MRNWTQSIDSRVAVILVTALLLSACGSDQAVRDLSKETAGNVALVSAGLGNIVKISQSVSEARINATAGFAKAIAERRSNLDRQIRALDLAGAGDLVSIYDALRIEADTIETTYNNKIATTKAQRTEAQAAQLKLTVPVKELNTVAEGLTKLSKEKSDADRIKYAYKFFARVAEDVKTARAKANEDSLTAEKKVGATQVNR